jgi:hypothetical protein
MKASLTGYILRGNFLLNTLLSEKYKGRGKEEEGVSCYWMILWKIDDTRT